MSIKIDRKSNRIRVVVRIRPVNDKDRKEIASTRGLTGEICVFLKPDGQTIELHRDMYDIRQFRFDRVFGSIASQGDVYEYACKDIIDDFTSGYDGCVLAYGQTGIFINLFLIDYFLISDSTGTGKTYSMFGDSVSHLQNNTNANSNSKHINNTFPLRYGIMQRSINDIFEYIEQCREEGKNARIYISFYQIYLEKITDLLDSRSDKLSRGSMDMKAKDYYLPIREDPIKGTYIEGLSVIPVQSVEEFMSLVNRAVWNRVTQVSRMNDSSSRSHAVMTLTLEQDDNIFPEDDKIVYNSSPQNDNNNVRSVYEGIPVSRSPIDLNQSTPLVIERRKKQIRNTLTFGDLAGSERIRLEGGSGLRLREGKIINQSICSLGMCIRALADRQSDSSGARTAKSLHHIPYRNSNLTRLLANSIGGKSKTCIISTIGPCLHSFEETHTTLLFASRYVLLLICSKFCYCKL
jgi:kinesin family protein 5